jgi:hypothetical protein
MSAEKEDNKQKNRAVGFLGKMIKIMLKIVMYLLIFVIFFSASLVVLFQFEGFRNWASSQISSLVSDQLMADIEFEDIHINLFKGIGLDKVRMITAGDTLAQMDNLYLSFQIKPFLDNHILVSNLSLENPRVKLLRSKDGTWNIDHIVKPSEPDTTYSEPSNMLIELQNIELVNADFIMYDSTSTIIADTTLIDFANLHLDRLNIQIAAKMETLGPKFEIEIKNISFIEKRTFFNLRHFAAEISADTASVNINELSVETDKSEFTIKAALDNVNIFSGEGLEEALVNLQLDGKQVNIHDIYHFADIDYDLSENTTVDMKCSGKLSEIRIDELKLNTGRTDLNLAGKLFNLTDTDNLMYDVKIQNSRVYYSDLIHNIPKEAAEAISDFNYADIRHLKAKGSTSFVEADLHIINKYGKIKGSAGIDFKDELKYHADIITENLNPGGFLGNPDLIGNINAEIKAQGSGSNLSNIIGDVDIKAINTRFNNYSFADLKVSAIANGNAEFMLDTLYIEFVRKEHDSFEDLFSDLKPYILSKGRIDLSEEIPSYDIYLKIKNINAKEILGNDNLPELFSGSIEANGKGFDLDELETELHTHIEETVFEDRSLMPFDIDITFRKDSGDYKELLAESELFSVFINGEYSYNTFFSQLSMQGVYIEQFVRNKINSFYRYDIEKDSMDIVEKIGSFDPIDISFEAKLFDLSPISPFLGNMEIYANASFDLDLSVKEDRSSFLINGVNISTLQIRDQENDIIVNPTELSGSLFMSIEDSLPKIEGLSLVLKSNFGASINDLKINEPNAKVSFKDSTASFNISSNINDLLGIRTNGKLAFLSDKFQAELDTLSLSYQDIATWKNTEPVLTDITYDQYILRRLILQRDSAETIEAFGSFSEDSLLDIAIIAEDFPFSDINQFLGDDQQEIINEISTGLDSLDIRVNGDLRNPEINMYFKTKEIIIRKNNVGYIKSQFSHKDKNVKGYLSVLKQQYANTKTQFGVNVNSLPLDLYLSGEGDRLHSDGSIDVKVNAERFPIVLLEPFASGVKQLNGFLDLNADLSGPDYESLDLEGKLKIYDNSSFLLEPTNMKYLISGDIDFNEDKIKINDISLKNSAEDLRNGKAKIYGDLEFDDFDFKSFDIKVQSDQFQVLSDASRKTLKQVFGTLIISTGNEPIQLFGSLDKPNIKGNLNVLRANLTLPQTQSVDLIESNVKYEIKGSKITVNAIDQQLLNNISRTVIKETKEESSSGSIINDLNIDLYTSILGRFVINMDLGLLGQLYAEIGMQDKTVPLHFVMDRTRKNPQISGELKLEEGSRLNYLKLFRTTGVISFQTGEIGNPNLNLSAVYNGKTFIDNETKDFTVNLYIKGTLDRLDFNFNYTIDGNTAIGDSSEIAQDAILLLLTGKTTAQWRSGGGGQTDVVGGSLVSSAASPLLSQAATELLQGTVGIENAEIDLSTGWDNARMQLTGRLAGDVVWRFGGTIADFSQNNEITIDIPLPLVIHKDYLNNIILQLTQATNVSQTATRNQKKWEVKLKFGGSW